MHLWTFKFKIMEHLLTNETLDLFNEYTKRATNALDQGEQVIPSFEAVIEKLGVTIIIDENKNRYGFEILKDGTKDFFPFLRGQLSLSGLRETMWRLVNNNINNVHSNYELMIYGQFAVDFKKYITKEHGLKWEDYKSQTFYTRYNAILQFASINGVIVEPLEIEESLYLEDVYILEQPNSYGIEYDERGLTLVDRIKLMVELIKDVSEQYNNELEKEGQQEGEMKQEKIVMSREVEEFFKNNTVIYDQHTSEVTIIPNEKPDVYSPEEPTLSRKDQYLKSIQYTLSRVYDTIEAKNSDYTADNADPLNNFLKSEQYGVNPVTAVLVRIQDKMSRISGLVSGHQAKVQDEKVEDTIKDAIGYFANTGALLDRLVADPSTKEQALLLVIGAIEDLLNLRDQLEIK